MKRTFKQGMGLLLAVLMLVSAGIAPCVAVSMAEPEQTTTQMIQLPPMRGFSGTERASVPIDGTVELIDGTAVNWADRAILPDSILAFYHKLVEGVDNDGVDDILIDDEYYLDPDYTIQVGVETLPLNGQPPEEVAKAVQDRYLPYLFTVFGALDRDHPEVFWLSNAWSLGSDISSDGTDCTVTVKVGIGKIRADAYLTEASIKEGIRIRDAAVAEICRDFTWETTRYERILHFNEVLTTTNQYNTSADLNKIAHDCRECISALTGQIGESGPVCEGYARAFKVLCDANDIPCVLVDGLANLTGAPSTNHMWNYVQMEDDWYGVDVTWNDPSVNHSVGAVSGQESEDWLLVGANTIVEGKTFISTHHVKNQVYMEFLTFTNGPTLSVSAYESALSMALKLPEDGYVYDGTYKEPQVAVKYNGVLLDEADYRVTYSNHLAAGIAKVTVTGKGQYNGVVTHTFEIRKRALTPILTVEDKVYDGTDVATVSISFDSSGLLAGDEGIRVNGAGAFVSPNAGEQVAVTLQWTLEGVGSENYTLAEPENAFATIFRRPVTVRANAMTVYAGESDAWMTYTIDPSTPLASGDRLVGKLNFDGKGENNVYAINQGTLTNGNNPNYDITFVSASLTVLPAEEQENEKHPPSAVAPSDPMSGGLQILSLRLSWRMVALIGVGLVVLAGVGLTAMLWMLRQKKKRRANRWRGYGNDEF